MTEVEYKKYELLPFDEIESSAGTPLYRIRALKDIPTIGVKKGDIGGYIAHEGNFSQTGFCWIYDEARVYANTRVYNS